MNNNREYSMTSDDIINEIREIRQNIMAECESRNITILEYLAQSKTLQERLKNRKFMQKPYNPNSKLDQLALT